MKKIILFATAVLMTSVVNAKVWRINPEANAKADFVSLRAACESTSIHNHDTLYCEAGGYLGSYEENVISRPVTVLGPGWGFEANFGNTTTGEAAIFNNNIEITADSVTIEGLYVKQKVQFSKANIKNIAIRRCRINWDIYNSNNGANDVEVKGNYIGGKILIGASGTTRPLNNLVIQNNIIMSKMEIYGENNGPISNVLIQYNTIVYSSGNVNDYNVIKTTGAQIYDNIIINTANQTYVMDFEQADNAIRRNVFSLNAGNVNANISAKYSDNYYVGATIDNTFTKQESIFGIENYYQLLESSPAKGGAYDGSDCGAFGGQTPYVVHGRPQGMPYIYGVEVPAYPTDNVLNISFKVKGQNE